jgi:MtfA peptidase
MPPDTTIILNEYNIDSIRNSLPPPAARILDSLLGPDQGPLPSEGSQFLLPQWAMFLVVLVLLALIYYVYVPLKYHKGSLSKWFLTRRTTQILKAYGKDYDNLLIRFNPYYASLTPVLKQRFLERVTIFMRSKNFIYRGVEEASYIPVLISATAVQVTFGLKNYLLDFFTDIYVLGDTYLISSGSTEYCGHVSLSGIHISWPSFLRGFKNYSDNINVGLHEMAHAVAWDNKFDLTDKEDRKFKLRLEEFTEEGKLVFNALKQGQSHILDNYATTNFQEFWAVSVETFFENPRELKDKEAGLYREISELLNQDPLIIEKIIDPMLA